MQEELNAELWPQVGEGLREPRAGSAEFFGKADP